MGAVLGGSMSRSIALVVRARCEDGEVLRLLRVAARQTLRPVEIGVIDSGSAKSILDELTRLSHTGVSCGPNAGRIPLRLLRIPAEEFQSARALNHVIREVGADLVAILSQDAIPADDRYFERLSRAFEDACTAGAYGRQRPPEPYDPIESKDLERTYPARSRIQRAPDCWFVNTCSMIRRELWELHPFAEQAVVSEDHQWAKQLQAAGWVIQYRADAEVLHHHHHYDDLRGIWRRFFDEARGLAWVHAAGVGLPGALLGATRETASDGLWLMRRGQLDHWPRAILRRWTKHAALYAGSRHGLRKRQQQVSNMPLHVKAEDSS